MYGETANILFTTLHDFRTVLTYFLIVLPVLVLSCLFVSAFDLKRVFVIKLMSFLRKRSSRRGEHTQGTSLPTTSLLRPLFDDRNNGSDGESKFAKNKWKFRESMLEMVDSSYD